MIVPTKVQNNTIPPEDEKNTLALSRVRGLGVHGFRKLVDHFGSVSLILQASKDDLTECVSIDVAKQIASGAFQKDAEIVLQKLKTLKVSFTTVLSAQYPALLKEIHDPPMVLYFKGVVHPVPPLFSIVGTRACTQYGRDVTSEFTAGLVDAGFGIVSGMAFGIDACAHKAALVQGGYTIAVLPGSVAEPSPRSNYKIYDAILEHGGAIVSEFPPGEDIHAGMFALRNRIVSGLSMGTLVVEAGEKSGALITAQLALEQGRECFAIPSHVYVPSGQGTNRLIQNGEASLVTSVGDIVQEFGFVLSTSDGEQEELSPLESKLINAIISGPLSIDAIGRIMQRPIGEIMNIVTNLELGGKIAKVEGGKYGVVRRK